MKAKTRKTIRHMLILMKRYNAYFWQDADGIHYTYPKDKSRPWKHLEITNESNSQTV